MSIFATLAAQNAPLLMGTFGETLGLTYIPQGGANITLSGMVLGTPPELTSATPRGMVNKTIIRILKSDYPTKPIVGGDKILASNMSKPATVQKIENELDPIMWNLTVE